MLVMNVAVSCLSGPKHDSARSTIYSSNNHSIHSFIPLHTARLGNPTQDILEQRFAKMENGAAAMATASGTAACFYAIINLCQQGDNFVSARNLYGGTYTQFNDILPQFGM